MDFSWAGIKQSVKTFWDRLSRPQKIITVLAPLVVAAALISLISWAGRPQYVAIFTKLSDTEAGAITTKLKDLKADYKLADNGSTIMVPQQSAADIRLQLASAGLPQQSKFSFDNLNTMHLGETDADRKLRYVLGLQNELENTLKTLNGVQDARVHIVMPESSLFVDSQKSATAAVTLKLAPETKLSDDQVRAVANLMARSVEGLLVENVTIVDTAGNVLSDVLGKSADVKRLTGTQYQLKQTIEEDTRKSIQSMLDRVLGSGKAVVRISATLDFDQIKRVTQTNGPGAVVSEQSSTETTTNAPATAGGTPGLDANGIPTYPTATAGVNSTSTKATATKNYQVDSSQEEQVVNPGTVKRLSVSVMADADTISQPQLDQIKAIVASAAGVDATRGDQIQVAAIPFNKTDLQQEKLAIENAQKRQQLVTYIEIGAVAVLLGMFCMIMLLRHRAKKGRAAKLQALKDSESVSLAQAELLMAQQLAEEEAELAVAQTKTKTAEELQRQKTREAVELFSLNNPDEAARLMKTWLAEES